MQFAYAPPQSVAQTTIDLVGYSDTDVIAREIGERSIFFEIELLEHIYLAVPRRGTFMDVGANIGNHAVYFAKFCAEHVLAIEPHPKVVPILRRNLEVNAPGRFNIFSTAVGASEGVGHMTLRPNFESNIGGSQVEVLAAASQNACDTVAVTTIDRILQQSADMLGKHPLTLVKIDIEGMEIEALKGASTLIRQHRPQLVIELATEQARSAVRSFLASYGYQDSGERFGWTPTYHFIDPHVHHLSAHGRTPQRDAEVELLKAVTNDLLQLVPEGASYILVDEDRWWAGLAADGRRRFSFPEREGVYWGPPQNDRDALSELHRLRGAGAQVIIFAEPAYWWLDYYKGLADYLQTNARLIQETPYLRAFAL